jgi:hypothetical protein
MPLSSLQRGLAHYWRLDQAAAEVRPDLAGTADAMVPVGSPALAEGIGRGAAAFAPGVTPDLDPYLIVETPSTDLSVDPDLGFTISLWYRPNSPFGSGAADRHLICKESVTWFGSPSFQGEWSIYASYGPTGGQWTVNWQTSDNGTNTSRITHTVSGGLAAWHHILAWYDPSNQHVYLQVDGGAVVDSGSAATIWTDDNPVTIGSRNISNRAAGPTQSASGRICEVGVWQRVLTATERAALYGSGSPGDSGLWPFPDASELTVEVFDGDTTTRRTLPSGRVLKASWSDERYGGWKDFSLDLGALPSDLPDIAAGDRVEFYWRGVRCYRGSVHTTSRTEEEPPTLQVSGSGIVLLAGKPVCQGSYLYPAAVDLARAFADIAADAVAPVLPSLRIDARDTGATTQLVEADRKTFADVAQDIAQNQGANLVVWGCDVDGAGNDRLFVKPFSTSRDHLYPVPGRNVSAAKGDEATADLVNRLTIMGGNPRYPNLIYNSSFERPRFGGEGTGNLVEKAGFEESGTWSGTGSRKQSGGRTGEGTPFAGEWMYETDISGEYVQQTQNPPATAIVVGRDYTFSFRAKCEQVSFAVVGQATLTWLDTGGSTISTETVALPDPTGVADPRLTAAWQEWTITSRAPVGATGFRVRGEVTSGGGIRKGILWDEVQVYDSGAVYQSSWEMVAPGTGTVDVVNWALRPQGGAQDGAHCLFVDVSAADSDAGEVRLQPVSQKRWDALGGNSYDLSVWLKSPPGITANGKLQLVCKEYKSDGSLVATTTHAIAAGSGWSSWTQHSVQVDCNQQTTQVCAWLAFRGNTAVYVDAFCFRDAAAGGDYLRDGQYVVQIDTDDAALTGLSAAAAASVATYGYRDDVARVDSVTTLADARSYAEAFFNAHAAPFPAPTVEVLAPSPVRMPRPGDLVTLGGDDGAVLMGGEETLPITRVRWTWDGVLKASIELKRERPNLVDLLLKRLKKQITSDNASSRTGSDAGTPPGAGAPAAAGGVAGLTGTTMGGLLVCLDGSTFEECLPVTDRDAGWLIGDGGYPLVTPVG